MVVHPIMPKCTRKETQQVHIEYRTLAHICSPQVHGRKPAWQLDLQML